MRWLGPVVATAVVAVASQAFASDIIFTVNGTVGVNSSYAQWGEAEDFDSNYIELYVSPPNAYAGFDTASWIIPWAQVPANNAKFAQTFAPANYFVSYTGGTDIVATDDQSYNSYWDNYYQTEIDGYYTFNGDDCGLCLSIVPDTASTGHLSDYFTYTSTMTDAGYLNPTPDTNPDDYGQFAGVYYSTSDGLYQYGIVLPDAAIGQAFSLTIGFVPEPATWTMLLVGVGGIGGVLRGKRRSRRSQAPA